MRKATRLKMREYLCEYVTKSKLHIVKHGVNQWLSIYESFDHTHFSNQNRNFFMVASTTYVPTRKAYGVSIHEKTEL